MVLLMLAVLSVLQSRKADIPDQQTIAEVVSV